MKILSKPNELEFTEKDARRIIDRFFGEELSSNIIFEEESGRYYLSFKKEIDRKYLANYKILDDYLVDLFFSLNSINKELTTKEIEIERLKRFETYYDLAYEMQNGV